MKKKLIAVVAVIALAAPAVSMAQLGGLFGGAKSSTASGPDLNAQQDSLVRNYVAAGKDVLTADGHLADALGINAQAVKAAATSDAMSESYIKDQDKAISDKSAAISDALKGNAQLKSDEAKADYVKGLRSLAQGVKKYLDLRKDAQGFTSAMSGASPLQMPKLQAGAYVAKSLPSSISNLTSVLKSAVDFAKSQGVEVPKDATSVL